VLAGPGVELRVPFLVRPQSVDERGEERSQQRDRARHREPPAERRAALRRREQQEAGDADERRE